MFKKLRKVVGKVVNKGLEIINAKIKKDCYIETLDRFVEMSGDTSISIGIGVIGVGLSIGIGFIVNGVFRNRR